MVGEFDERNRMPPPRFAVAGFSELLGAEKALRELRKDDVPAQSISILAQSDRLAHEKAIGEPELSIQISNGSGGDITCVGGTFRKYLQDMTRNTHDGPGHFDIALAKWLLPRHAAQLTSVINQGGALIWVQICESAQEQRIVSRLLEMAPRSVEVHDLRNV